MSARHTFRLRLVFLALLVALLAPPVVAVGAALARPALGQLAARLAPAQEVAVNWNSGATGQRTSPTP